MALVVASFLAKPPKVTSVEGFWPSALQATFPQAQQLRALV
jgi:hypothetical protein